MAVAASMEGSEYTLETDGVEGDLEIDDKLKP